MEDYFEKIQKLTFSAIYDLRLGPDGQARGGPTG
jgi:hypothetical protein